MNSYDQDGKVGKEEEHTGRRMVKFEVMGLSEGRPSVLRGDKVMTIPLIFFPRISSSNFLFQ